MPELFAVIATLLTIVVALVLLHFAVALWGVALVDEAIAEAKLEAVERFFLFDTEVKRGLYVEELKKAAGR